MIDVENVGHTGFICETDAVSGHITREIQLGHQGFLRGQFCHSQKIRSGVKSVIPPIKGEQCHIPKMTVGMESNGNTVLTIGAEVEENIACEKISIGIVCADQRTDIIFGTNLRQIHPADTGFQSAPQIALVVFGFLHNDMIALYPDGVYEAIIVAGTAKDGLITPVNILGIVQGGDFRF